MERQITQWPEPLVAILMRHIPQETQEACRRLLEDQTPETRDLFLKVFRDATDELVVSRDEDRDDPWEIFVTAWTDPGTKVILLLPPWWQKDSTGGSIGSQELLHAVCTASRENLGEMREAAEGWSNEADAGLKP